MALADGVLVRMLATISEETPAGKASDGVPRADRRIFGQVR